MSPLRLVVSLGALPLLLLLPGHLLLQWLRGRAEARLSLAGWIFQSVLASTLLTSALAFPLAELGLFSLRLLLGLLVGLSCLLGLLIWRERIPFRLPRPAWGDILPLFLALLVGVLAFRPHQYVLGSGDAGSYTNIGVSIARTGGILLHDPTLATLDPGMAQRELLFSDIPMPHMATMYHHIPAFLVTDLASGKVMPQFYHLFPTWIAIGYDLFGLRGCLYVTPLFAVLAALAIYFAGQAIFGRWAGLAGSLLLSANLVQVWFSRYPTSEIFSQYFLFSSFAVLVPYLQPAGPDQRRARWNAGQGVLAGGALAALLHTRVDSLLALVPVVLWGVYLLVLRRERWRAHLPFFLVLTVAGVHFALYLLCFTLRYTLGSLLGLYSYLLRPVRFAALALLGGGGFIAVAFLSRCGWLKRHEGLVRWICIVLLSGLALFAYFIWPAITPPQTVTYYTWPESQTFTFANDENLVRLGWYLTPWGILLGVLGLLEAIRREPSSRIAFFLGVFLLYGVIYIYHGADTPVHIHAVRRYVPMVIPALALGAAYLLQRLGGAASGKAGRILAAALGLALLVLTARPTWPLLRHVDYAGAVDQVAALAGRFDPDDILLFTDVEKGTLLGMPLHYIFHRPSFILQRVRPDPAGISTQLRAWEEQGKEVYLIVAEGRSHLSPSDFTFLPQGTVRFTLPRLEQTTDRPPREIGEILFSLEIYRLRPGRTVAAGSEGFVDVGEVDYPYLGEGFWGKEIRPDGVTFRWTQGEAELVLPAGWFSSTGSVSLTLSMGHGRPGSVPPPNLEIFLGNDLLARLVPKPGIHTYSFAVPAKVARELALREEVHLRLRSDVWQPSASGLPDERKLGVVVDSVRVRRPP